MIVFVRYHSHTVRTAGCGFHGNELTDLVPGVDAHQERCVVSHQGQ